MARPKPRRGRLELHELESRIVPARVEVTLASATVGVTVSPSNSQSQTIQSVGATKLPEDSFTNISLMFKWSINSVLHDIIL